MIVRTLTVALLVMLLAGCAEQPNSNVRPVSGDVQQEPAGDISSVEPSRCVAPGPDETLADPVVDVVERTPWRLVKVGSCDVSGDAGRFGVFFMEGSAGLPADCNGQSAPFRADGERFIVEPDLVGTTTMMCGAPGPTGYLGSVTTWGTTNDGRLYMLDEGGNTVFVIEATGPPGCIATVAGEPNSRRLATAGDPSCIQS